VAETIKTKDTERQAQKQELENKRIEDILEYEKMFLGSLLYCNPDELKEYLPDNKINSFYFYSTNHGKIYDCYLKQKNNPNISKPDISTIGTDPDMREIGASYISSLTSYSFTVANIQFYHDEIIKAWKTRTAKRAAENFLTNIEAANYTGEIEPLLQEFQNLLTTAQSDKHADSFITFDDYINTQARKEYWREYTPRIFGNLPFPDGTISAIGAAPGSGKSAALINLCRELLTIEPTNNPRPGESEKAQNMDANRKILFISAEMSTQDLTDRLIHSLAWQTAGEGEPYYLETVSHTNKDYWKNLKLKYGTPPEHWEYTQAERNRSELYSQVIEGHIRPAWGNRLKIAYVRGRKCFDDIYHIILNNTEPGALVLMDYLQLMPICNADIGEGNPRYLEIRHVMDMGIIAAEKTQSVIIAAAQLGREDRKEGGKRDNTQGWRESGDIEQTAWNLIKLARKDNALSFNIVKARNSTGVDTAYKLDWIPAYQYMAFGGKQEAPNKPNDKSSQSNEQPRKVWKTGANA
jgi:replicative DNA helicase